MLPTFSELTSIYLKVRFEKGERTGKLLVDSASIIEFLQKLQDTEFNEASGFQLPNGEDTFALGDNIEVEVRSPKPSIGYIVDDPQSFLKIKGAVLAEPASYYIISDRSYREVSPPSSFQQAYRRMVTVLSKLSDTASYVDILKQEFVFVENHKVVVPFFLQERDVWSASPESAKRFCAIFEDKLHTDQKYAILSSVIVRFCAQLRLEDRLGYLLQNLDQLSQEVVSGYKLFASSFSYSKITRELEQARLEFIGKIHKTIVDVQGQLLGIPLTSIVVASSMKSVKDCDPALWSNLSVVVGAWVFLLFLSFSAINQWSTLTSISSEVRRQREKLKHDYSDLGEEFVDIFRGLECRIMWHQAVFVTVVIVSLAGGVFTTALYNMLTGPTVISCVASAG